MDGMTTPQKLTLAPIVCSSISCHCLPEVPTIEPLLCSGYEALGLAVGGDIFRGGEGITSFSTGRWLPEPMRSSARLARLSRFNCVSCNAIPAKQSRIKGLLTKKLNQKKTAICHPPSKLTPMKEAH